MTDTPNYSDFKDVERRIDELSKSIMSMFDGLVEDFDPDRRREVEDYTQKNLIQAIVVGYVMGEGKARNHEEYIEVIKQLRQYFALIADDADSQTAVRNLFEQLDS